ncbi:PAS domain S-box protein [Chromobacterium haemolyticum]|nr:PAS domain S-box protein [Chromobacterium haemolyticum]
MDSVGIGIHWVDAASGRLIYVNRYAAELLGYGVDEMLSLNVSDIVPNTTPEIYAHTVERLRQQSRAQFETQQRTRDGRLVAVEMTAYYLPDQPGGSDKIIGFVTDITRRKETEQALVRAKEDAEAANLAKSAFVANMSHEIRTPLNAIIGFTHLLMRTQPRPEQQAKLEKVLVASGHLLGIINDILDLSKIEAGKLSLERTDFSIGALFDHVRSLIDEPAQAKGLRVEIDYAGVPPCLRGDSTRLRQALLNYAGNAVKFTERGTITMRARLCSERGRAPAAAFRGARHRHRHSRRQTGQPVSGVSAGGRFHHPQIRRYRPGFGDYPAPGRVDGRRSGRGKPRGAGQRVLADRLADGGGQRCRRAGRRGA